MIRRLLPTLVLPVLGAAALVAWRPAQDAAEPGVFAHDTIHFGIVVSDIDAAAKFYTEVLGLAEDQGFEVPASMCTAAGLTDGQPLAVRVFATDVKNDDATRVKLMQVPGIESKPADNAFVHSQLGISYLTVGVRDIDVSMARVRAAGGDALGDGPIRLGTRADADYLALVRDPDGNLIELIGPKSAK